MGEVMVDFNVEVLVVAKGTITGMDVMEVRNGMVSAEMDIAEEVDAVEEVAEGRHQFLWVNGGAASRFHTTVDHRTEEVEGEEMDTKQLASWTITCPCLLLRSSQNREARFMENKPRRRASWRQLERHTTDPVKPHTVGSRLTPIKDHTITTGIDKRFRRVCPVGLFT